MASQSILKRAVYSSTTILTACTNTNAQHHHHHQHQNAASPSPSQKQKQKKNNLAAKLRQHARADATANSRRRPTYANCSQNFKLISTLQATALTLLTLTLSSWIAYGTAASVATATAAATAAQFEDVSNNGDMSGLPFDYAALVLEPAANAYTAMPMAALPSPTPLSSSSPTSLPYNSNSTNAFLAAVLGGSTAKPNSSISIFASSSTVIPTLGGTSTSSTAIINSSTSSSGSNQTSIGSLNASMAPQLTAEELDEEDFVMPPMHAIFVSLILLVVILGTVVGNVLVCIAVCMVRKLRRPCNYLLVSLALSDLCVAVLVMPMALLYEVLEAWNFGPVLCDIWVSFDVLCCTASILNLCAISVDRYLAITKPLEYGVKRTPRRMMLCVAVVWLAAACISLPPLLILGNEHVGENGEPICTVCQNSAYQIYATLGSFYIPLSVMLFVYYQIFRAARRIVLEEKRAQTHLQHALNGTGSPQPLAGHTELDPGGGNGNGNGQRHSSVGNTSLTYSTCGGLSGHGHHGSGGGVSGSTGLLGSPHHKKLRFQLAKEKKASTTLGIIMSAFTICWLPFFILALIRPFVESETTHVPASLSSLFLWLGYANSLLNPIIYATLNRDFRKPFQEILYFRCSSLNTMMRENYYQDQYGEPPSQRVMLGDERHGARESFL